MPLLILILTLIISGCTTVDYFEPTPGKDIFVEDNAYRGPDEIVEIKPSDKVKLKLIIFPESGYPTIRSFFKLPKGEILRFSDGKFKILEKSGNIREEVIPYIKANVVTNGVGERVKYKSTDILHGENYKYEKIFGGYGEGAKYYQFDLLLKYNLPDHFSLIFPEFYLNGVKFNYQPIVYQRKMGTFYQVAPW